MSSKSTNSCINSVLLTLNSKGYYSLKNFLVVFRVNLFNTIKTLTLVHVRKMCTVIIMDLCYKKSISAQILTFV